MKAGGFGDDDALRRAIAHLRQSLHDTRTGVAMNNIAPLAITMGDASGIGPEIVAKTLARAVSAL